MTSENAPLAEPPVVRRKSWLARLWSGLEFLLALVVTGGTLAYLLFAPTNASEDEPRAKRPEVVKVIGPGLFQVADDSPFAARMMIVGASRQRIKEPLMTVTGRVAASLRPSDKKGEEFWQFDAPEVLTAYTDWQKARADITFTQIQLSQVKALAAARLDAQGKVVARLTKLVAAGTDAAKDLANEKANLLQIGIQGRKDIHEAETAVRVARRAEAASTRLLQQGGLDPDLLRTTTSDTDIVLADVPEGLLIRVKAGQGCQARFFGFPKQTFTGKVNSIAPVLSKERRSLRVLFVIHDPRDQLRPGMFAEIGLGTDPREAVLVPADAVLHLGRDDYVLVAAGSNTWRVTEVQVGEARNGSVEIVSGLKGDERLIGKGAILFKPVAMNALKFTRKNQTEGRP